MDRLQRHEAAGALGDGGQPVATASNRAATPARCGASSGTSANASAARRRSTPMNSAGSSPGPGRAPGAAARAGARRRRRAPPPAPRSPRRAPRRRRPARTRRWRHRPARRARRGGRAARRPLPGDRARQRDGAEEPGTPSQPARVRAAGITTSGCGPSATVRRILSIPPWPVSCDRAGSVTDVFDCSPEMRRAPAISAQSSGSHAPGRAARGRRARPRGGPRRRAR